MKAEEIIKGIVDDGMVGSLNYLWEVRYFLKENKNRLDPLIKKKIKKLSLSDVRRFLRSLDLNKQTDQFRYLSMIASYNYIYINQYLKQGSIDRSLNAILDVCFNPEICFILEYSDPELDILAKMFNLMFKSVRKNLHCYDCGTVARGIFYNLIKEYRHSFHLTSDEIFRLREEYMHLDHDDGITGLKKLMNNLRQIEESCVFIVGLKFGDDKFGHIFIIEKKIKDHVPVIRFYQSALNSYLLMDYIVKMNYFENSYTGIDLDDFEKDMESMINVTSWGEKEELLFVKWFAFYPQSVITDTSKIRINSSYLIYRGGSQLPPLTPP